MIERVDQKPVSGFLVCPEITIPAFSSGQTSLVSVFGFTLRWGSVLLGALVTAVVLKGEPPSYEALAVLGPLVWADRTALSCFRIRRR
ncbi:hypothetical protein ACFXPV_29260 [Streptomyces sp. NPDC059118]|uniref:hypothetical protein n=1 Tax=unclassified Streptomyces TaxID=2593676 RepID=UPI0036830364